MSNPSKVFYQGESKDFVIFVENDDIAQQYSKDSTIPLVDVVGTFKVYTPENGRGVEGVLCEASKSDIENEFGSKSVEEVIALIIKQGSSKHNTKTGRKAYDSTNDTIGNNH